jgi:UDP-N-acetylglucosamine diphosphorylase/glucosamine-1-phosphate N-acetyltransferase
MRVAIFEDAGVENFLPLVYFRPIWELRCGISTLLEKIRQCYPDQDIFYTARQYLMHYSLAPDKILKFNSPDEAIFINGRLLIKVDDHYRIDNMPANSAYVCSNEIVVFRCAQNKAEKFFVAGILDTERVLNDCTILEDHFELMKYPWDLIYKNGEQICQDFAFGKYGGIWRGKIEEGCHIIGKDNVYLGESSRILPGAVLMADNGPIWIGSGTVIMPNAVLKGPISIADKCDIKTGAKIYENTSIGPVCKVGGEVEETIIQEYTNKQHDGFLGHSYLGAWINIGADTNNSDLKNNYGYISVFLNNQTVNTEKRFLGLLMGDHSKTAINTMFNTGTVVGVSCNIFGEGFPPKFLPSFSWGGSGGLREYNFEKAIEVAKIVMDRRNISFSESHFQLFKAVKDYSYKIENRIRIK